MTSQQSKINIQIQSWSKKIASILQDFQSWSCPCSSPHVLTWRHNNEQARKQQNQSLPDLPCLEAYNLAILARCAKNFTSMFMETYFIKFHQKIAFDDFRVSWPLKEFVISTCNQWEVSK